MRHAFATAAVAVWLGASLAGCGSRPAISSEAARDLAARVRAVRAAVDANDAARAAARLDRLRRVAVQWRNRGELEAARYRAIATDIADVAADLRLVGDPAATSPTPPTGPVGASEASGASEGAAVEPGGGGEADGEPPRRADEPPGHAYGQSR